VTALRSVPLTLALAALALVALGASCGDAAPPPASVYDGDLRADLHVERVAGRWLVTLNGFPVWDRTDEPASTVNNWIDPDLNQALVSEGNELRVEVWPRLSWTAGGPAAGASSIRGSVVEVGAGPVAGTAFDLGTARPEWERALRAGWERWRRAGGADAARDSVRAWAEANPVAVSVAFDVRAGAPSFDAVFRAAPVIAGTPADSARLRAYAVRLRDLLDDADAEGVYREIGPSISDSVGTYQVTMEGTRESDLNDIRREWTRFRTDFAAADVGLRSWAGGRVWELYRDDGVAGALGKRALLLRGDDRLETWLRVYVGEVDGALRVVRITP
jgi:hypothetical protein